MRRLSQRHQARLKRVSYSQEATTFAVPLWGPATDVAWPRFFKGQPVADSLLTAADLLKLNNANARDLGVTDILRDAPLLRALHATTASNGTKHTYLKQSGAPVVGFRNLNAGRDMGKSSDAEVTIDLKILSANSRCDKALADVYRKGGPAAFVARETERQLIEAFKQAELQIVRGTGNDSDGFVGLQQALSTTGTMVKDAGGTIASGQASTLTSVWFIRTNPQETDVCLVLGENGNIEIGETFIQMIADGDGKLFPNYVTPCEGWAGLQIGGAYSIARVANISTSVTVDDALLMDGLMLFPEEMQPNLIVMNRRSRASLQKSRQAVSTTGQHVALPTEFEGIPIITTSAIGTTETRVVAPS